MSLKTAFEGANALSFLFQIFFSKCFVYVDCKIIVHVVVVLF